VGHRLVVVAQFVGSGQNGEAQAEDHGELTHVEWVRWLRNLMLVSDDSLAFMQMKAAAMQSALHKAF